MTVRCPRAGVPLAPLAGTARGDGADRAGGESAGGRIPVVTSTTVGSVVKAGGWDAVDVRRIIRSPAADPHSCESTPTGATAVARARLPLSDGHGDDGIEARSRGVGSDVDRMSAQVDALASAVVQR